MVIAAPTRRAQRATLALASLGFISLGLPEGLLGVAWPSIRATFDLPLDALGLLLGTFASGYFVSSALSGRLLTSFGIGSVLSASCATTGMCLLGYALAPSWPAMVILGGVLGIGAGIIDSALNTFAAMHHGSRVLNWMHAAFGLGAAVGPLVMTAILSAGVAWALGYVSVALAQLGLAVAYWLTRQQFTRPTSAPTASTSSDSRSARQLLRNPLIWISLALFGVYAGTEITAGQWSFSLLTVSRNTPTALAGLLIGAYWASLTLGRVLFGIIAPRVSPNGLLRVCILIAIAAAAVIWLNVPVVSWLALAVLGLVLAPIFPVLIAETPARLGRGQTANAVGLEIAVAVLGGAALPAAVGVLAARLSLEVVGPCLVAAGLAQLVLHEALVRLASEPRRSARSRSDAAASFPPGA
jgi:fucose permease